MIRVSGHKHVYNIIHTVVVNPYCDGEHLSMGNKRDTLSVMAFL